MLEGLDEKFLKIIDSGVTKFDEIVRLSGLNPYHDFKGQDLSGVEFSLSNLNKFDFSGTDLSNSDFRGAIFDQTNFTDANLNGSVWDELPEDSLIEYFSYAFYKAHKFIEIEDHIEVMKGSLSILAKELIKEIDKNKNYYLYGNFILYPARFYRIIGHKYFNDITFAMKYTKRNYEKLMGRKPFLINTNSMGLTVYEWEELTNRQFVSNKSRFVALVKAEFTRLINLGDDQSSEYGKYQYDLF